MSTHGALTSSPLWATAETVWDPVPRLAEHGDLADELRPVVADRLERDGLAVIDGDPDLDGGLGLNRHRHGPGRVEHARSRRARSGGQAHADDHRLRLHLGPGRPGAALAGAGTDLVCARFLPA
jgi:hypothetical protein